MKTNIGIELTEDQRIDLGQKYYKKKRPITRADLNIIVKDYINKILEAESYTLTEKQDNPFLAKEWSSLSQFRDHLRQQDFTILSFDGFQFTTNTGNLSTVDIQVYGIKEWQKKLEQSD